MTDLERSRFLVNKVTTFDVPPHRAAGMFHMNLATVRENEFVREMYDASLLADRWWRLTLIWNSDWIADEEIRSTMKQGAIVDRKVIQELLPIVSKDEISAFDYGYWV